MRLIDYIRNKIKKATGGLIRTEGEEDSERELLINDKRKIVEDKLREAMVWYTGDSDELLNFYTLQTNINYNYEPLYSRNKRGYFWSISSTEHDIKRTHSGQPRNIVDTLVSIVGKPEVTAGMKTELNNWDATLEAVLEENEFWNLFRFEQMPMTLVEGWGCYKIDWDLDLTDKPIIKYYRAKDVEFIEKNRRLKAIIFKDYYTDGKLRNYLITETRALYQGNLRISKEVFEINGDDLKPLDEEDVAKIDELEGIDLNVIEITNFNKFLAVPCIFYKDLACNDGYGRSIYYGKFDLFDDLDQCLSQSSNTVRRSTAIEYFNTDFLERDKITGLPKMPKAYDRKYTSFIGGKNSDGTQNTDSPVQVTQPQLQFNEYNAEAQNIMVQIISGIMSPATLGIDVAKKDNADAQREKEKVTIFTRNTIIDAEKRILKSLFNQVLGAVEYLRTGKITVRDFTIGIKFSEFADDSFENKLQKLGEAYIKGTLSTDMYLDKLYGDSLSQSDKEKEKKYLEEKNNESESEGQGMPMIPGMNGPVQEDDEFDFGDEKPGFKGVQE